jgi:hypothetical protein
MTSKEIREALDTARINVMDAGKYNNAYTWRYNSKLNQIEWSYLENRGKVSERDGFKISQRDVDGWFDQNGNPVQKIVIRNEYTKVASHYFAEEPEETDIRLDILKPESTFDAYVRAFTKMIITAQNQF